MQLEEITVLRSMFREPEELTFDNVGNLNKLEAFVINETALLEDTSLESVSFSLKLKLVSDRRHPRHLVTLSTTLTIPTFNTVDPELWFLGLDLFFQRQHIVDEVDELHMALTAMPDEAVAEFRDFLPNALNLPDPFTTFKQLCLKRTAQTKDQRILQALTNEELNDGKPSQFLRRLQRLLGGDSDDIVGSLFLSRFPLPIRTAFVPFQDRPLTERAELADQIAALQPTTVINAVVD
ncbi:hypothetical protein TSPI_10377 [Trichinella spiralis]|uniref:DUF7041 domain-containing protein n=1 Tax=Trichinella spiralis TaxID=6334 RepID=A0ABR3KQI5_TRISP